MELKKKVLDAINNQINAEFYSEYLYLSMAAYFESNTLKGFSKWMKKQAEEERKHALKFFDYVLERGGKITLEQIQKPKAEWKSPLEAFKDALSHEQKVTARIINLLEVSNKESDYATASMLKWFIDEQVEEEASAQEIVEKLKYAGTSNGSLLMLDHQLGKRE